jgi:HAE1 family hydrophobic/amphiphilic exporter-1
VLDGIAFPPGYRYSFGGSTKNMQESFTYALARWRWRWSSST